MIDSWNKIANIQGWFEWPWLYAWAAKTLTGPNKHPVFVEIGTWIGKSFCFLGLELKKTGYPFTLIGVDTFDMNWKGPANAPEAQLLQMMLQEGKTLEKELFSNLNRLGLTKEDVTIISGTSTNCVDCLRDQGLGLDVEFAFIDGDHTEKAVYKDIDELLGAGILCGHDYDYPGVQNALRKHGVPTYALPSMRCWTHSEEVFQAYTNEEKTNGNRT